MKDSFNYRAQDFYPLIESFGERFKDVGEVFFYCASSRGRGPRVAGWSVRALTITVPARF